MHTFKRLAFVVLTILIVALPLPAQAKEGGNLDLLGYCQENYPNKGTTIALVGKNPDANSWRCRVPLSSLANWPSRDVSVSMTDVCQRQYGEDSYTLTSDPQSPYAWKCYN